MFTFYIPLTKGKQEALKTFICDIGKGNSNDDDGPINTTSVHFYYTNTLVMSWQSRSQFICSSQAKILDWITT